ncbi:hypothetical protein NQ176_g7381 [Zarea fungicola]|uniref:Uncharacterized protein n=1 Tax=Zarea fungicola TaxID=93591 RepID=A0ACC1N0M6_9HYPO|nr:hypothetical protein NQ176_g7381 [Lecanicillium fungicola]
MQFKALITLALATAVAGHRPQAILSTPRQLPHASNSIHSAPRETPCPSAHARHPVTPTPFNPMSSSSSAPSRQAKLEFGAHTTEDDDLDLDDPFGLNKRRLNRQKSREQLKRTRSTLKNTPSPSDTMPSFM